MFAFWYRKGGENIRIPNFKNKKLNQFIEHETSDVFDGLDFALDDIFALGKFSQTHNHNKINDLFLAKKSGFNIPNTMITNQKSKIVEFLDLNKKVVVKNIAPFFGFQTDKKNFWLNGTQILSSKILDDIKSERLIYPTMIQNYIEKKFEIRIFFIEDEYFPMAIFSQENEKTKVDFRNYDIEKPNRNVPFILPKEIEDKIKIYRKLSGHLTGSIDMIYSNNNEYIYLENNPSGQYGWVSDCCNYYIDQKLASYLILKYQINY